MIFKAPNLPLNYTQVLVLIEDLRARLRHVTSDSLHRWTGYLARTALARAIHGSNTMEGINVTLDEALAVVDRDEPLKPQDENWLALVGYREAMDYILQLSKEAAPYPFNDGTILGLHFMMMKYDLSKNPGRWRPGAIHVTNTATGKTVYEGPSADRVPHLMAELVSSLNEKTDSHIIIRAAMAHLNLTMIHPFKDGNGRMARALQTMVLSRQGILSPIFSSIEEYVGRNTQDYYSVLGEVGQGSWNPRNDALPWIRFCLIAHYRQAQTYLRRIEEGGQLWERLQEETKKRKIPERAIPSLMDAAMGRRVRNTTYRNLAQISTQVAKKDLRVILDTGLLVAKGERRGRYYIASNLLEDIREASRLPKIEIDPFAEAEKKMSNQPDLFL